MWDASAALLAVSGFVFIHDNAVHANAQVGSQAAFVGIKFVEQLAFTKFREKSLREILGRLSRPVPSPADIFGDWFPVGRAQRPECVLALLRINAARRFDHRPARGGESDLHRVERHPGSLVWPIRIMLHASKGV